MKTSRFISSKERNLLLIFAFTAFIFVFVSIASQTIKNYNYSVAETQKELANTANLQLSGTSSFHSKPTIPLLHLLTLFILAALIKTKKYLLSSFLTVFYAGIFIFGLYLRFNGRRLGGEEFSPKVDFFRKIYSAANNFDYIAALFILILLFWQISILLRMLIKTQRTNILP